MYTPHDDSRSETQHVEASSQPFRLTGSGGEGNGVARHHDDHYGTSQRSQNGGVPQRQRPQRHSVRDRCRILMVLTYRLINCRAR
ncbi:hypothetical protein CesoFtcFv8_009107 [Champsocephalus esox]|uniref:Uncharacterized protein n=1 Tax=Champsocephalus esox TaxID=159716 RepID=A0AAN8H296_9TELE|nr:hypothetical protein CesoFtcFv8_009107 [Champsocephalus esox]